MIEKIDHIGIAVRNLEEAKDIYSGLLGLAAGETEELEEQKLVASSLLAGDVKIELLEPTHPDGPVGRFIGKRGEGFHHIAFRVEDIEECLEELKAKGMKLIDEKPRIGAGGAKIAFLHPKGTHGVLVELVERD